MKNSKPFMDKKAIKNIHSRDKEALKKND